MSDSAVLGERSLSSRSSRTPALWMRRRRGGQRSIIPMVPTKVFQNRSRRLPTCVARSGVSIIEALYSSRAPIISHRVAGASTTIDRILLVGLANLSLCSTFPSSSPASSFTLSCGTHALKHQVLVQSDMSRSCVVRTDQLSHFPPRSHSCYFLRFVTVIFMFRCH